jgi:hypothetical protein
MTLEALIGSDASLLAGAADIASAQARAGQGSLVSPNTIPVTAAVPSNLTAPSSVVIAGVLFTPSDISEAQVSFDFFFTDSAADTVTVVVQEVPTATAIAGGTGSIWHVENGGTPVSITGAGAATIMTLTKTLSAAGSSEFHANFIIPAVRGVQCGFQFIVSAAHNLSAMVFNGIISEV